MDNTGSSAPGWKDSQGIFQPPIVKIHVSIRWNLIIAKAPGSFIQNRQTGGLLEHGSFARHNRS